MFNWFRRQMGINEEASSQRSSQQEKTKQPEAKPIESEETEAKDLQQKQEELNWAKTAYQNIQEQKTAEETKARSEVQTPEKTIPTPSSRESLSEDKSESLEPLKESGISTSTPPEKETPEVQFDEDFVWSSKVLASQGRTPEDVSEEEISWLKRLRKDGVKREKV